MRRLLLVAGFSLGIVLMADAVQAQSRIVVCGTNIRCDDNGNTIRSDAPPPSRLTPEQEQQAAEARRRGEAVEADFARRRNELRAAATLRANRAAEAERIRRMQYDAMIARLRAQGCWVPGDPPGTGRPCVAPQ